ncbi:MAG: septum formation inhibitor Maf [Puniceicoccales bacterium]
MISLLLSLLLSGSVFGQTPFPDTDASDASQYWFDKAEITRYELTQVRYGEARKGESVLIFVTEPFLTDEQVKHEFGPGDHATPVLKLNRIRSFTTGIYDYRLMASVFHPILDYTDQPAGLKIAMTSTEWCGLVFQQVNRRNDALETELRSYFQSDGDQNLSLPNVWTEDELWLRLRIDPATLPTGEFPIFPELFYQRLAHLEPAAHTAIGSIHQNKNAKISTYEIEIPDLQRILRISYESAYPHRILGWTETVKGELFSQGKATHTERLYYWDLKHSEDTRYREQLGITRD